MSREPPRTQDDEPHPRLVMWSADEAEARALAAAVDDLVAPRLCGTADDAIALAAEDPAPLVLADWSPEHEAAWRRLAEAAPGAIVAARLDPADVEAFAGSSASDIAMATVIAPVETEAWRATSKGMVNARRRLAACRDRAEAAEAELESFLYVVSHDLKAPIQGLLGVAGLLREQECDNLSRDGLSYCDELERSGVRLAEMVDALTILSRLGRSGGGPERVDLGELVEEVFAEAIFRHGERIPRLEHADLPVVRADRELVRAALSRLVDNAIVFNDDPTPRVEITARRPEGPGGEVELTVRDGGVGIPEGLQEQAFELFSRGPCRRNEEGVGAGLAIVRRAAHLLGGRVRVESAPGEGSLFHLRFPEGADADAGGTRG